MTVECSIFIREVLAAFDITFGMGSGVKVTYIFART